MKSSQVVGDEILGNYAEGLNFLLKKSNFKNIQRLCIYYGRWLKERLNIGSASPNSRNSSVYNLLHSRPTANLSSFVSISNCLGVAIAYVWQEDNKLYVKLISPRQVTDLPSNIVIDLDSGLKESDEVFSLNAEKRAA